MVGPRRLFELADVAQQVVGGFLLAGPSSSPRGWDAREQRDVRPRGDHRRAVLAIGYGALYEADHGRDPEREVDVAGIPLRFVSFVCVSYPSVALLALAFAAPTTFEASPATIVKAVGVGAIFSVIGAATADTLF